MSTEAAKELLQDGAIGVPEAAALSGLSVREINNCIRRGDLTSFKFGKRRLVPRRAVIGLLANRMTGGAAGE